jgi:tetratricopeptide (TPR) repeat protein
MDNYKESRRVFVKKAREPLMLVREKFMPSNFFEEIKRENEMLVEMLNNILEGRVGEAIRLSEKVLEASSNRRVKFWMLFLKGLAYFSDLLLDAAVTAWDNSLRFSETVSEKVILFNNTGLAYLRKGDLDKSIEFFGTSLELCEKNKLEDSLIIHTLNLLGEAYYCKGLVKKAEAFFSRGLKISMGVKDFSESSWAHNGLARIRIFKGDYKGAMESINENLRLFSRGDTTNEETRAMVFLLQSQIYRDEKRRDESIKVLWDALREIDGCKGIDSARIENLKWLACQGFSETAFKDGNLTEARKCQEQALTTAVNSHDKLAIGKTYLALAKINATEGRDSINYIINSLTLSQETNSSEQMAQSYHQLGDYYRKIYPLKAIENYNLALAFYKGIGYKMGEEKIKEKLKWIGSKRNLTKEDAVRFITAAKEILPSLVFIETKECKKGRKPYRDRSLLLLCLLKLYLDVSYRAIESALTSSPELRKLADIEKIPDHNTIQRAAKRFGETYLKGLLKPILNILE